MKMKKITVTPVQQMGSGPDDTNSALEGATHVETYTIDERAYGGAQTLVIFAFYPDRRN